MIIIGAGAAGLMCAIQAGRRARRVLVLDHANKAGKKILMSGGGRCNFTNYQIGAENYSSRNPHFCKSALSRFTQWDFIAMVEQHRIAYHEREHGQLFCDHSAKDILAMLLRECRDAGVDIQLRTIVSDIERHPHGGFTVSCVQATYQCRSLVVASGGLSIPKMGASAFGYKLAEQFGITVHAPFAGLVPFTWHEQDKRKYACLAGIAITAKVSNARQQFVDPILFTHRGLSGPAMLQMSSYWRAGETVRVDLLAQVDLQAELKDAKQLPNQKLKNLLNRRLPKRLLNVWFSRHALDSLTHDLSAKTMFAICDGLKQWQPAPNGTEGYRTAEVTVGGVDCDGLSSRTMESTAVSGLYFIGEVMDVTGWLGGFNFQWAWSSGWCAGQYV